MITKPRANSVITHEVTNLEGAVGADTIITFRVAEVGELQLNLSAVSVQNLRRAQVHGFCQRINDAAALSRDTTSGKPASPSEKFLAMQELVEHYNSGTSEWRLAGRGTGDSLLIRALVEVRSDRTAEQIREFVKALSGKQRAALSAEATIAPVIERMRAEAGKGIDTEELLSGL